MGPWSHFAPRGDLLQSAASRRGLEAQIYPVHPQDHIVFIVGPALRPTDLSIRYGRARLRHNPLGMTEQPSGFVVAVVDDDPSILRSLAHLLESAGYAVRVFTSAAALLESGALPEIDCLISDIDMPSMDGVELLRLIYAIRPDLPAILITGYPDRLKRLPPLGGMNPSLFTKPFHGPELLAAVGDALRNSPGRDSDRAPG